MEGELELQGGGGERSRNEAGAISDISRKVYDLQSLEMGNR